MDPTLFLIVINQTRKPYKNNMNYKKVTYLLIMQPICQHRQSQ